MSWCGWPESLAMPTARGRCGCNAPFTLEGTIDRMPRVLDTERYARYSSRFASLATRSVDLQTGALGTPRRIHFDVRGRAEPARGFDKMPGAAVALRGGDYLVFEVYQHLDTAQRCTPKGDPAGGAIETAGLSATMVSTGLRGGGVVMAYVASTPDREVQVRTQRLVPAPQP